MLLLQVTNVREHDGAIWPELTLLSPLVCVHPANQHPFQSPSQRMSVSFLMWSLHMNPHQVQESQITDLYVASDLPPFQFPVYAASRIVAFTSPSTQCYRSSIPCARHHALEEGGESVTMVCEGTMISKSQSQFRKQLTCLKSMSWAATFYDNLSICSMSW